MYLSVPWIVALLGCVLLLAGGVAWALSRPSRNSRQLPTEWALSARPVFSTDERRVYRLLSEALPHHVILSKLPLVRFCQPTEAKDVRYWYELLGSIHVTFAICSPNGRVLAAIDLDTERNVSGRSLQIKQSVLGACRVRYLRCPIDNLPSAAELQLLVPFGGNTSRGPQPAPTPQAQAPRRAPPLRGEPPLQAGLDRLWQDSALFHDSFFAPDSRYDSLAGHDRLARSRSQMRPGFRDSDFRDSNFRDSNFRDSGLHTPSFQSSRPFADALAGDAQYPDEAPNDIVGVVVDTPRYGHR